MSAYLIIEVVVFVFMRITYMSELNFFVRRIVCVRSANLGMSDTDYLLQHYYKNWRNNKWHQLLREETMFP